jgi:hypothetical protein
MTEYEEDFESVKRAYRNFVRRYNRRKKKYLELKKEFEHEND